MAISQEGPSTLVVRTSANPYFEYLPPHFFGLLQPDVEVNQEVDKEVANVWEVWVISGENADNYRCCLNWNVLIKVEQKLTQVGANRWFLPTVGWYSVILLDFWVNFLDFSVIFRDFLAIFVSFIGECFCLFGFLGELFWISHYLSHCCLGQAAWARRTKSSKPKAGPNIYGTAMLSRPKGPPSWS